MTMIRSDGLQEVVNAGVEPGHSSTFDRNFGGTRNHIIGTCTGSSQYQIAAGPCIFAGVEISSGAATISAFNATDGSSQPFWSRALTTQSGGEPVGGPVWVDKLFITLSTTTCFARILGIAST
jgi:hypothetical protein